MEFSSRSATEAPCEQLTSSAEISSTGMACSLAFEPSSSDRHSCEDEDCWATGGMRMRPLKIVSPRSPTAAAAAPVADAQHVT